MHEPTFARQAVLVNSPVILLGALKSSIRSNTLIRLDKFSAARDYPASWVPIASQRRELDQVSPPRAHTFFLDMPEVASNRISD
jgi:hypothetical protein